MSGPYLSQHLLQIKDYFEYIVMPFGMKTTPATFRRMICDSVLQGLESFADAYIDDVEVDTADTLEDT